MVSILIKGISVLAVIAVIGAAIFGFLTYRAHKERAERILRQQRREKRLKKWGYSTKEFDQIMEEHLRSKSQIKKPGLRAGGKNNTQMGRLLSAPLIISHVFLFSAALPGGLWPLPSSAPQTLRPLLPPASGSSPQRSNHPQPFSSGSSPS